MAYTFQNESTDEEIILYLHLGVEYANPDTKSRPIRRRSMWALNVACTRFYLVTPWFGVYVQCRNRDWLRHDTLITGMQVGWARNSPIEEGGLLFGRLIEVYRPEYESLWRTYSGGYAATQGPLKRVQKQGA